VSLVRLIMYLMLIFMPVLFQKPIFSKQIQLQHLIWYMQGLLKENGWQYIYKTNKINKIAQRTYPILMESLVLLALNNILILIFGIKFAMLARLVLHTIKQYINAYLVVETSYPSNPIYRKWLLLFSLDL
jgi:hypothetical protein